MLPGHEAGYVAIDEAELPAAATTTTWYVLIAVETALHIVCE